MRGTLSCRHAEVLLPAVLVVGLAVGCNSSPGATNEDPPVGTDPPAIGTIADRRMSMGERIEVPFSVVDEVPATVVVRASSDDQTLVSDVDLEVAGSGAERVLHVAPSEWGTGSVVLTLTATDETGLEGTEAFRLDVTLPFQTQLPKLTASDAADWDLFGFSVAMSGDHAIIGAPADDLTGTDEGSAYVFKRSGDMWIEVDELTASDAAGGDNFGYSVAIDGDYVIIGAYLDDLSGTDEGSAYVFKRSGDSWVEVDKLAASDAADADYFGNSVAIAGNYAIVGASGDDLSGTDEGSAYVFERSGDAWSEVGKLTAGDAANDDLFGISVAIAGDDVLVGAYADDLGGANEGSVYVFKRSGDTWNLVGKLMAGDAADDDFFGVSVAIAGDDAIVGAFGDDLSVANEGSAYVFERSGGTWGEVAKLTASDAAEWDLFGRSVAVSGDYAIIGAYLDDLTGSNEGSAYVFKRSGDGWVEVDKLTASDAADADRFGFSVAIDADFIIVGADSDDVSGENEGSAYVFLK